MYGMPSCYNNGFAFARHFINDGFDLTVACDQNISTLAAAADVPFRHLQSLSYTQTTQRYLAITQSRKPGRIRKWFSSLRVAYDCWQLRQQTLEDNEYLQLIDELQPDVLLIDIECHLAVIAGSTLNIPTAICTRLFNHRPGDGVAPLHSNLLPLAQTANQLRVKAQWWKLRMHSTLIAMRQNVSKQRIMPIHYRSVSMPDIKAIADRYRVDLRSISTTAHWFRPVTYTHVPILSMTLGDLDFNRSVDNDFTYMGPMIGERDYAFDLQADDDKKLDCFINQANLDGRPIIYCAMGTYAKREPGFVDKVSMLTKLRPDYAFIVSLGGRDAISLDSQFGENVLHLAAAPQLRCLAKCHAAILHAGIASLQEALHYRVPVLCFSVGTNDQNGTAARWVNHKLATRFSHTDTADSSLANELDRLLNDVDLAKRIERYGKLIDESISEFSPKKLIRNLCA